MKVLRVVFTVLGGIFAGLLSGFLISTIVLRISEGAHAEWPDVDGILILLVTAFTSFAGLVVGVVVAATPLRASGSDSTPLH